MIDIGTYQCEERSHVSALDLNSRFGCDCGRVELMAIEDQLVGIVGDHHLHARLKRVQHFSYHPPNNKRLQQSRHGRSVNSVVQR